MSIISFIYIKESIGLFTLGGMRDTINDTINMLLDNVREGLYESGC